MIRNDPSIGVYYEVWSDSYAVVVAKRPMIFNGLPSDDKMLLMKPPEFEEVPIHGSIQEPSFRLQPPEIQSLFDQLWKQGLRPKDGTGNSGHIEALKFHLEDMRKLVFKTQP